MPRLFVAIDMPQEVGDQLDRLCQGLPDARWTDLESFHLTLRFVGEVDPPTFVEIGEGLLGVRMPPFELKLAELGHFPPRGIMRQLWAGLRPSEELDRLKRAIDKVVDGTGAGKETRKFVPHVTLARFQTAPSRDRLESYLARRSLFESQSFPVSSFTLYSSRLKHDGAEHTVEAEYDFVRGVINRD